MLGALRAICIELVLPAGYVVTEAAIVSETFECFSSRWFIPTELAFERVQTLGERLLWENADISLRAEKPIEKNAESFEVPWMNIPNLPTVDQTLELAATDSWAVQLMDPVNGERSLVGRGAANSIASLYRSDIVRSYSTRTNGFDAIRIGTAPTFR